MNDVKYKSKAHFRWVNLVWGLALGIIFFAAAQLYVSLSRLPVPYTDVVVNEVVTTDNGYFIYAEFNKTDCTFRRLEVFGNNTGQLVYLPWVTLDNSPSENYDRSVGEQHLPIEVYTEGRAYDQIEIRTRHLCGDILVDKVFAKIDIKEELQGG